MIEKLELHKAVGFETAVAKINETIDHLNSLEKSMKEHTVIQLDGEKVAEFAKDINVACKAEKMYTIDEIVKVIKEYFGCPFDLRNGCQRGVIGCTDCLKEYVSGWLKGE